MSEYLDLDEILKAIGSYKSIKKKAIVSLIFTSSMKASKVCELRIEDFVKASNCNSLSEVFEKDLDSFIPCWRFSDELITFNTPTTTEYIVNYLKSEEEPLDKNWPLFYSSKGAEGYYTKKSIEQMISNHDNKNFNQRALLDYFKHICKYNLLVNDIDKKFIIDLYMGQGSSDNPFINKIDELEKHYISLSRYFGYDGRESDDEEETQNANVRNIVSKYYHEYVMPNQEDFEFEDHFELRHNAHLIAEKDAKEGNFKTSQKYLNRLFKKAKIEYIVYRSDYYSVFTYHPDRPIPGPPTNFDEKIYKIINELGLKEELEISEELLKKEIIAARIEENISPYYSLTHKKLMIIFDCILLNIVDEIYLSDGI